MSEWQPIKTAPIPVEVWNCTDVIIVWNGEEVVPCVAWRMKDGVRYDDYSSCDRDGDYCKVIPDPTHWMPLPTAPVSA